MAWVLGGLVWIAAAAVAWAQPMAPEPPAQAPDRLSEDRVRFRSALLVLASVSGTFAYGRAKWWQDGFSGGFKTVNEGWFGAGTDHGGADKLGHGMFAYAGTRLLARGFEWAGNEPDPARRLGAYTAVGILMAVEVVDGFSEKWRFSKEDALADIAGGALGYWLEAHPAADALLDIRLQYSPSTGPQGRRGFDPFSDYSGQRYLLVFKASGVPALKQQPLLRYLELSVGYGARHFEPESRGFASPSRHLYYGVSLNLTELLRATAFSGNASPSRTQRVSETFFEFVQLPGVVAAREHEIR